MKIEIIKNNLFAFVSFGVYAVPQFFFFCFQAFAASILAMSELCYGGVTDSSSWNSRANVQAYFIIPDGSLLLNPQQLGSAPISCSLSRRSRRRRRGVSSIWLRPACVGLLLPASPRPHVFLISGVCAGWCYAGSRY